MTTDLRGALVDAAEGAPSASAPPELWTRGRRRRRRRVGTALVAATVLVLLAGAAAGWDWQRRQLDPGPADGRHAPAVPDRVWRPSAWLPGTDDVGPIGPLAAIVDAERGGWTGTSGGTVGISAVTGRYAFLDLPDDAAEDSTGASLSKDGTALAFPISGETTGEPNTSDGRDPVAGVGILDTATGALQRLPVSSPHGLMVWGIWWLEDGRLVLDYGTLSYGDSASATRQGLGRAAPALVIDRSSGSMTPLDLGGREVVQAAGDSLVTAGAGSTMGLVDVDTGAVRPLRLDEPLSSASVSDDLTRVAGLRGGRSQRPLYAGTITRSSTYEGVDYVGRTRHLAEPEAVDAVTGWGAGGALIVGRWAPGERGLVRVDPVSGTMSPLIRGHTALSAQYATDLLSQPPTGGIEPPDPRDPRGVLAAVIIAALVLLLTGWGCWCAVRRE